MLAHKYRYVSMRIDYKRCTSIPILSWLVLIDTNKRLKPSVHRYRCKCIKNAHRNLIAVEVCARGRHKSKQKSILRFHDGCEGGLPIHWEWKNRYHSFIKNSNDSTARTWKSNIFLFPVTLRENKYVQNYTRNWIKVSIGDRKTLIRNRRKNVRVNKQKRT